MKIAIFGKSVNSNYNNYITELFEELKRHNVEVYIFTPFLEQLKDELIINEQDFSTFDHKKNTPEDINYLISIGGDGTLLESTLCLDNFNTPIIGLNLGRLGFLANISKEDIKVALEAIFNKNYKLEKRSMLNITPPELFHGNNFALNEFTLQKNDSTMVSIETYLNDEYLYTYWTDGLIISTPTGSTAYNMSVGGPIVEPGSKNFIIAPIASHNLSVRPLVIPDDTKIKLIIKSRSGNFLVTSDNRSQIIDVKHNVFFVEKANFTLNLLKLPFNNYYATLRNKLMWGIDKRN